MEIKKIAVVDILSAISTGVTKKEACHLAGISVTTFDRYLAEHKDMVPEFVTAMRQQVQARYSNIATTRMAILDKLITKVELRATSDDVSIEELFMLEKELGRIQDTVEKQLGILDSVDRPAASAEAMLTLPTVQLRPGTHRIVQRTVTLDFDVKGDTVIDASSAPVPE